LPTGLAGYHPGSAQRAGERGDPAAQLARREQPVIGLNQRLGVRERMSVKQFEEFRRRRLAGSRRQLVE
jgi:hypothetical protein